MLKVRNRYVAMIWVNRCILCYLTSYLNRQALFSMVTLHGSSISSFYAVYPSLCLSRTFAQPISLSTALSRHIHDCLSICLSVTLTSRDGSQTWSRRSSDVYYRRRGEKSISSQKLDQGKLMTYAMSEGMRDERNLTR